MIDQAYRIVLIALRKVGALYFILALLLLGCDADDSLDIPVNQVDEPSTPLDIYIDENFVKEFNIAVRYKFVDNFVQPTQRVTPPKLEVVRPMLEFIQDYWIDSFLEVPNGEAFFRRYVPVELVLLGGLIYNGDGTVTLGVADAGARITFTDVNSYDPSDEEWRALQLRVTFHEFAHIVHQEFSLPAAYETISKGGYTGPGSWFSLSDQEALQRGFVSPYATSSPNEDFAEVVAFYTYDADFFQKYIDIEPDCATLDCEMDNAGRKIIADKLEAVLSHYQRVTDVNLTDVRNAVQRRLAR